MELLLGFAFLAGIITVASPCVLPVLPVILAGSVSKGSLRPLGTIVGFILSFTALTLGLSLAVRTFGFDPGFLRILAGVIILGMAVVLIVPKIKDSFMDLVTRIIQSRSKPKTMDLAMGKTGGNIKAEGFLTGFVTGLSLGIVWTPCVGPIMASVITLAVSQTLDSGAVLITLAYALGTAIPLFIVMQGGRAIINRFPGLVRRLNSLQRGFGILMLFTGIALLTGLDRRFQTWFLDTFPSWGAGLTAIENNDAVNQAIEARSKNPDGSEQAIPDRTGTDPLMRTSGQWFNSDPLSLKGLEGKVVLVDFWTYSCVNCLRTLPYLRAWHQRYKDLGLVIVGVHTPEFAFETRGDNLKDAMEELQVTWPVVQDNDFGIWNAFSNRFWPAHYLFDRGGNLIDCHFGEGGYEITEQKIRMLLGLDPLGQELVDHPGDFGNARVGVNPETYLGALRGKALGEQTIPHHENVTSVPDLAAMEWKVSGPWRQTDEYLESSSLSTSSDPKTTRPSKFYLQVQARQVFLVISTIEGEVPLLEVTFDGKTVSTSDVTNGSFTPMDDRLYRILDLPIETRKSGILSITIRGRVRLHALTFS